MNNKKKNNQGLLTLILILSIIILILTFVERDKVRKLEIQIQEQEIVINKTINMLEQSLMTQDKLADELIEVKTRLAEFIIE